MPRIYVMCGLPGSGKTTVANELVNSSHDIVLISPDIIRRKLYGDPSIQGDWNDIWTSVKKEISTCMSYGLTIVYDATNITVVRRKSFMDEFKAFSPEYVCVFVDTPLTECVKRNMKRCRIVPIGVIKSMYSRFEKPTAEEGFTSIVTIASKYP